MMLVRSATARPLRFLLLPILFAAACGSATPAPPPAPAAAPAAGQPTPSPAPDILAPPFTAADLRAGIPVGTVIVLRVTAAGKPPVLQNWTFTAADAVGCTIHSRLLAEDGTLITDEGEGTSSWAELESHAHFPAALTTRTDSAVDVPAGHFDTWLFEIRPEQPGQPARKMHFARTLPGPPVWMEVTQGDTVLRRMELVSRTSPAAP